jgi:hypothetical protein
MPRDKYPHRPLEVSGRATARELTATTLTKVPSASWHVDAPPPLDTRRKTPPQRVPFKVADPPMWLAEGLIGRAQEALTELDRRWTGAGRPPASGWTVGVTYWDGQEDADGEGVRYHSGPFVQSISWRSSPAAALAGFSDLAGELARGTFHIGDSHRGACYFLTVFATASGDDLEEWEDFEEKEAPRKTTWIPRQHPRDASGRFRSKTSVRRAVTRQSGGKRKAAPRKVRKPVHKRRKKGRR